jgi:hypothetical protein
VGDCRDPRPSAAASSRSQPTSRPKSSSPATCTRRTQGATRCSATATSTPRSPHAHPRRRPSGRSGAGVHRARLYQPRARRRRRRAVLDPKSSPKSRDRPGRVSGPSTAAVRTPRAGKPPGKVGHERPASAAVTADDPVGAGTDNPRCYGPLTHRLAPTRGRPPRALAASGPGRPRAAPEAKPRGREVKGPGHPGRRRGVQVSCGENLNSPANARVRARP